MAESNTKPLDLNAGNDEQLEPTEREEHFFKAMIDAADGSTPEELEPTERKEHWYSGIINAIQNGGGSSGGGGSGNFIVVHEDEDGNLDKTWQEIHDADFTIYVGGSEEENGYGFVTYVTHEEGYPYRVYVAYPSLGSEKVLFDSYQYATDSASGYPSYYSGEA